MQSIGTNKNILRIMTIPERIRNLILFLVFHIDKWHISPSGNRIYPVTIIKYVNKLCPLNSICEIGCGLGDIISKLKGQHLLGLDRDENVLRAASFLHKSSNNLEFRRFELPTSVLEGRYDLIIAVNWLHGVDETIVKKSFSGFFDTNLNDNGFIIVDSVNNPSYKYCHDFGRYFSDIDCTISLIGQFPSGRTVLSIQKTGRSEYKNSFH